MSLALGELLVSAQAITREQLERALEIQRAAGGGRIGDILVEHLGVSHDVVVDARLDQVWYASGDQSAAGASAM